jgi:hypothetical protein
VTVPMGRTAVPRGRKTRRPRTTRSGPEPGGISRACCSCQAPRPAGYRYMRSWSKLVASLTS